MGYLIFNDYKRIIQSDNLMQVIGSDLTILQFEQLSAQSEVVSYLSKKYDTDAEFAPLLVWDASTAYKAKQRVYLDAPAYNAQGIYGLNSMVLFTGGVFLCTTAINAAEPFNIANWQRLGNQYAMFFAVTPHNNFFYSETYLPGDNVFYKDKVYTCKIGTAIIGHGTFLQAGSYNNIPAQNIFPTDKVKGTTYWGVGESYQLTAGETLLNNPTKWATGDTRNPQLVNYCIDIALYHLHSRIAPRNIPELRVKRRDEAIEWLVKAATEKNIVVDLPLAQNKDGYRTRFGGNVKNINSF